MDGKEFAEIQRKIDRATIETSVKNYGAYAKAFRIKYESSASWECYHQLYFNLENNTIGVLTGRKMVRPTRRAREFAGPDKSCLITFEAKEMLIFLEETIAEIKKMQQGK